MMADVPDKELDAIFQGQQEQSRLWPKVVARAWAVEARKPRLTSSPAALLWAEAVC
jgi:hypothetical protein